MPQKQKDLFGNSINEAVYKKRVYLIEEKINPSEDPVEFDHEYWETKAEKFREMGDKEKELECQEKIIDNSGYTSPAEFRKGTLLVELGEFDEAMKWLNNLNGCESHDTYWALGQLQMARVAALQGKKDDMIEYLTKAMKTTLFFKEDSGHYSKKHLIEDIEKMKEFDNYRNLTEFKEVFKIEEAEYGSYGIIEPF